jgi:hypothetical protein
MKQTVFIGDIHGRTIWKKIVEDNPAAGRFVFIGDYFDSHTIPGIDQMRNFEDIIEFKKTTDKEVVLLTGNHDIHYYGNIKETNTSGFQRNLYQSISHLVYENKSHLQMAYSFEDVLCTHAGVSEDFMNEVFGKYQWNMSTIADDLNELFLYKPRTFLFHENYFDPYGDDVFQTPIWIRPRSLMKASKEIRKVYKQIVGHTKVQSLDLISLGKWTGGKYFLIDTFDTSGEYLVREEDGTFNVKQTKDERNT